jgi:hypothetical protein
MPAGSNSKRERQYEHIKESYEKRGQKGRAEEIAARTVNKERAEAGETKGSKGRGKTSKAGSSRSSSKSSGSSKPSASSGKSRSSSSGSKSSSSSRPSASSGKSRSTGSSSSRSSSSKPTAKGESRGGDRTRAELYKEATRKGIEGRSKMNKAQLERAVAR